ncbi:PAS domain-containing protein [Streptomyces sp. NPDC051776]|uniref:PAS domain-containing protein n=1 Tax=Streptomyces sp. NPDC051776 TaxID=3155414 RepID=UPI0034128439
MYPSYALADLPLSRWTADSESRIIRSVGAIFEDPSAQESLERGCTTAEFFDVGTGTAAERALREAVHGNTASLLHRNGRPLLAHLGPLEDPEGRVSGSYGYAIDITSLVRSEEEFLLSAEKSRRLSFLCTGGGQLLWASPEMMACIGFSGAPVDGTGEAGRILFRQLGTNEVMEKLGSVHRTVTLEALGSTTHVDGFLFPVRRGDGTIVVGGILRRVFRDNPLTESKPPEEGYLARCLELLSIRAYVQDSRQRITWVSPAVSRDLGITMNDIVGRTPAELGNVAAEIFGAREGPVTAEQSARPFQASFRRDDGSMGSCRGYRFPVHGSSDRSVGGVFIDTSEVALLRHRLAEREACWTVLYERSPLAHATTDMDFTITDANGAFAEFTEGIRSEIRGKNIQGFLPDAELERNSKVLSDLAAGRRSQCRIHTLFTGTAGTRTPASVLVAAIRDSSGRPRSMLWIIESKKAAIPRQEGQVSHTLETADHRLLCAVAAGSSDSQAARLLGIGESTVRLRLASMRRRLGARNRAHLVARAYEQGILTGTCVHALSG